MGGRRRAVATRVLVTAASLKRMGVFDASWPGHQHVAEVDGHRVAARYDAARNSVSISISGPRVETMTTRCFATINKASGFGSRVYLICPSTGRTFEELRLYNGDIRTRPELQSLLSAVELGQLRSRKIQSRIEGTDGRGPARGAKRVRLEALAKQRKAPRVKAQSARSAFKEAFGLPAAEVRRLMNMVEWGPGFPTPPGVLHPTNTPLAHLLDPMRLLTPADLDPTQESSLPVSIDRWSCLGFSTSDFKEAVAEEAGGAFARALGRQSPWEALIAYPGPKEPQVLVVEVSGSFRVRFVRVLRSGGKVVFLCPITGELTHHLFVRACRVGGWTAQNVR